MYHIESNVRPEAMLNSIFQHYSLIRLQKNFVFRLKWKDMRAEYIITCELQNPTIPVLRY